MLSALSKVFIDFFYCLYQVLKVEEHHMYRHASVSQRNGVSYSKHKTPHHMLRAQYISKPL